MVLEWVKDLNQLAKHVFADIAPGFHEKAEKGDKKADEQACDPATNADCPPAQ
jgi:hypothetical protein